MSCFSYLFPVPQRDHLGRRLVIGIACKYQFDWKNAPVDDASHASLFGDKACMRAVQKFAFLQYRYSWGDTVLVLYETSMELVG